MAATWTAEAELVAPLGARSSPRHHQADQRQAEARAAAPCRRARLDRDQHRRGQGQRHGLQGQHGRAHARRGDRFTPVGSSRAPAQQQRPGLADRHHRAGDQHGAGAQRVADRLASLGERRGHVEGVGQARRHRDPVLAVDLARRPRPARSAGMARSVAAWVHTTCSKCGSKASSSPSASLSAITPTTPTSGRNVKASSSAAAIGPGSVRVVRGVEHDGGAAAHHLQPAGRGDGGEAGAHHLTVERLAPRKASTAASATHGVLGLVGAVQRQEDLLVAGRARPAASSSWPPTAGTRATTPISTPSRTTSAPTSRPSQQHLARLGALLGQHHDAAGLDDAGLLLGDRPGSVAEVARRGRRPPAGSPPRSASTTLVASQVPPMPTSTTATSTGASANAANAMATTVSKNDSGKGLGRRRRAEVGRHVVEGRRRRPPPRAAPRRC